MAGSYIYFANLHHLTQQTILLLYTTGTKEKLMSLNQFFFSFFLVVILQKLLSQKVGTTRSSAAQHYAQKTNRGLAEHLERFTVPDLEEGIARLRYINNVAYKQNQISFFQKKMTSVGLTLYRDGRLDLLIGDTPILDYYRANDPGCTLRTVDVIEEDNYAVGMTKGLRLQVVQ